MTLTVEGCRLDDLVDVLREPVDPARYPHADRLEQGVLGYAAAAVAGTPPAELVAALSDGPGVVMIELAVRAPEIFVDYYANEALARVSEAWLGPGYQVTSQPNVVNPGAAAQVGHRDYYLGFLTGEQIERYPEHVHRLSPVLTLQGAVAHSDMPVQTGPTCYLPGSQRYPAGYLVAGRRTR